MKKLIISTFCFVCASITLNAQSKSTGNSSLKIKNEITTVSSSHLQQSRLGVISMVLKPEVKSLLLKSQNTPIENAGKSLTKGGRYLYWGTIATAVGQLLTFVGEPGTGTLLSLAGTIVIYSGYQQITLAGKQLQQTESN